MLTAGERDSELPVGSRLAFPPYKVFRLWVESRMGNYRANK